MRKERYMKELEDQVRMKKEREDQDRARLIAEELKVRTHVGYRSYFHRKIWRSRSTIHSERLALAPHCEIAKET